MAGASLLSLLDDITALLDDVGVMTRVAAQKTVGLLGDDLALNAEQVAGVAAKRELPVVWSVAKGSLVNKAILIPVALTLNVFLPFLTIPLLMCGGAFLSYEGFHKVYGYFFHHHTPVAAAGDDEIVNESNQLTVEEFEKKRIFGAIRTDFVLSAEIIVIALGEVLDKPVVEQALVLSIVGFALTIFVYGLVGFIVKIDDIGVFLAKKGGSTAKIGRMIVVVAPILMRVISAVGTVAMFLVGGGIFAHNVPAIHHVVQTALETAGGGVFGDMIEGFFQLVIGLLLGSLVMLVVDTIAKIFSKKAQYLDS